MNFAVAGELSHQKRVCPWPCPARAWKSGSPRDPFFQTDVHDLPLLLGRLLQFGCLIIVQPPSPNLQDFTCGLSRRADDKNPPELLLVLPIAPFHRRLYGFLCPSSLPLCLFRPPRT